MADEPKIRLYGITKSRAARCMWALNELGVAYEQVPVSDRTGETREPAFLAINPNGKVPYLVDASGPTEVRIFESLAINLYLARAYGKDSLWPRDVVGEGALYQWTLWAVNEIESPVMVALYARDDGEQTKFDAIMGELARSLAVLENSLADREYLIEDRFTLVDLNVAANCVVGAFVPYDFRDFPRILDWLGRCYARPAAHVPDSNLERFRTLIGG